MRKVAFEIEIPMVIDDEGTPSTPDNLENFFKRLSSERNCNLIIDPVTRAIVGVSGMPYGSLTPDNAVSTLELSSDTDVSIQGLERKWKECLKDIHEISQKDVRFLSLSRQPNMSDSQETYNRMVSKKSMYQVINRRGWSHRKGLTTASVQPNIDVSVKEMVEVINCLNALSGPMIGLFANSPIFNGSRTGVMESRVNTWKEWMATSHIKNDARMIGMLEPMSNWTEYLKRIWDHPIVYLPDLQGKDAHVSYKKSMCLVPENENLTMLDFLASTNPHRFRVFNGFDFNTIIELCSSSGHADKGFWWAVWSARVRAEFDNSINQIKLAHAVIANDNKTVEEIISQKTLKLYVEVRDIGTTEDPLSAVALVLGIIENLEESSKLVQSKSWDEWVQLRTMAIEHGYDAVKNEIHLMLDIAHRGLLKRGKGEEKYLEPLLTRTHSPAEDVLKQFEHGGISEVIQKNQL